jgi:capsular exopolysaccharide synthesis family protein
MAPQSAHQHEAGPATMGTSQPPSQIATPNSRHTAIGASPLVSLVVLGREPCPCRGGSYHAPSHTHARQPQAAGPAREGFLDRPLPPPVGLRDYVAILRRRQWVVVVTTLVALGMSAILSQLTTPSYSSTARLVVRSASQIFAVEGEEGISNFTTPDRRVQTLVRQLSTEEFETAALAGLPLAADVQGVSVSAARDADIIEITARSTDPATARDAADAFAQAVVDDERRSGVDAILAQERELRDRADEIQGQLATLDAQIDAAERAGQPVAALTTNRQAQALLYADFVTRADELQINARLTEASGSTFTGAPLPTDPTEPKPLQSLIIAGVLGLLAGLGLAFVIDLLDDRLKSMSEIETVLGRLKVLGSIPRSSDMSERIDSLAVDARPEGEAAEAFRGLRTALQFLRLDYDLKTLLVTSPMPGEGKTTLASNLAACVAQTGQSVVVVDCDLRRPRLAMALGLEPSEHGLVSVLAGEIPLSSVLVDVPLESGGTVTFAPFGLRRGADPVELLSSPRVGRLLDQLAEQYGLVIVDAAPLLPVADALPLAKVCDAVLLVTAFRATGRAQLSKAVEQLSLAGPRMVLPVVTKVTGDAVHYDDRYSDSYEPRRRGLARLRRRRPDPTPSHAKRADKRAEVG